MALRYAFPDSRLVCRAHHYAVIKQQMRVDYIIFSVFHRFQQEEVIFDIVIGCGRLGYYLSADIGYFADHRFVHIFALAHKKRTFVIVAFEKPAKSQRRYLDAAAPQCIEDYQYFLSAVQTCFICHKVQVPFSAF